MKMACALILCYLQELNSYHKSDHLFSSHKKQTLTGETGFQEQLGLITVREITSTIIKV